MSDTKLSPELQEVKDHLVQSNKKRLEESYMELPTKEMTDEELAEAIKEAKSDLVALIKESIRRKQRDSVQDRIDSLCNEMTGAG